MAQASACAFPKLVGDIQVPVLMYRQEGYLLIQKFFCRCL